VVDSCRGFGDDSFGDDGDSGSFGQIHDGDAESGRDPDDGEGISGVNEDRYEERPDGDADSGSKSGALETILSDLGTFLAEFESDPGDPGGDDTGDNGVFGGSPSSCRQDLASTGHTIFFDEVAKRGEVYDAPTIRDGTEPHRKATRYKRHPVGFGIKGWWKMVVLSVFSWFRPASDTPSLDGKGSYGNSGTW
jgi:hypothetical protein